MIAWSMSLMCLCTVLRRARATLGYLEKKCSQVRFTRKSCTTVHIMITRKQMIINNLLIILKIIKVAQQKQRLARQHEQRLNNNNNKRTQLGGWNSVLL